MAMKGGQRGQHPEEQGQPVAAPSTRPSPRPGAVPFDHLPTARYAAPDAAGVDEPPTLRVGAVDDLETLSGLDAPVTSLATRTTAGEQPSSAGALIPVKRGEEQQRALALANAASPTATTLIPGARRYRAPARTVVPRRSGPRSVVIQFVVSMITTAMLIGALALTTPLGQAAALNVNGPTRAYTGALPWMPTPTATPKPNVVYRPPAGSNPGSQAVINDIIAVFGSYAQGALNVAHCESGYDPNAWNSYPILNSHASGVFQILYPSTWNSTSYASSSPFNADANIHAAYQIFKRDGYSWREWQCQP